MTMQGEGTRSDLSKVAYVARGGKVASQVDWVGKFDLVEFADGEKVGMYELVGVGKKRSESWLEGWGEPQTRLEEEVPAWTEGFARRIWIERKSSWDAKTGSELEVRVSLKGCPEGALVGEYRLVKVGIKKSKAWMEAAGG